MFKNKKLKAFTLAEVLTVLGIIGVVAAVTLPNLNNSTDEQVNVAKAKKVYGELSSAWDRAMIKNQVTYASSSFYAEEAAKKINSNLKIKGVSSIYAPSSLVADNWCKNTATLLADGSTYCVKTPTTVRGSSSSTKYFNIAFDVDGPNKGVNQLGYDNFYASLAFPSNSMNVTTLEPVYQGMGSLTPVTANSIMVSGSSPTTTYGLLWLMTYDNLDYLNCPATVKWITVPTCK